MAITVALVRPNLIAITAALEDVKEPTNVWVQCDKAFGFVRYSNHTKAVLANRMGNTQSVLYGKQVKCSWVSKPTPLRTSSNLLPSPVPAPILSPADLFAYEHQLAMSKMALMHPQGQHPFKHANTDLVAVGASQAIYDGGFQSVVVMCRWIKAMVILLNPSS
ncbi:nucleotide-binding alpha-beta plait domain-containing protein [Tanacetum coccineum]